MNKTITYREAKLEDARYVYDLNSDVVARKHSFSQGEFSFDHHLSWFQKEMNNKDHSFYIVLDNLEQKVGVVRIQLSGSFAVISINIDPATRGRGYGLISIRTISRQVTKNMSKPLLAYIKPSNYPSLRVFEKAGYQKTGETKINGTLAYIYTYENS